MQAIVTGANSGLGLQTVRVLAAEGATVVLACRSAANCKAAMDDVRSTQPSAKLEALLLDLADAASVRAFAAAFLQSHTKLDLLINNAAIMSLPTHFESAAVRGEWSITVEGNRTRRRVNGP